MEINVKKTKVMVFSKKQGTKCVIGVNGKESYRCEKNQRKRTTILQQKLAYAGHVLIVVVEMHW